MPKKHPAMTAAEYVKALEQLHLTPYGAAPVFGISRRQSLRYAAGSKIPIWTVRFLQLLKQTGVPKAWSK